MGRESGRSNAKGKESQIIRVKKEGGRSRRKGKKIAGAEPGKNLWKQYMDLDEILQGKSYQLIMAGVL